MGSFPKPWCNHYHGMSGQEQCGAGVRFDSLANYGTRQFLASCPCFGPNGITCDKAEYPTADEMNERERKMCERFDSIGKARRAIVDSLGGPWKRGTPGASGAIDCPVCGNSQSLHFSRAGYNGHIHASCETDGCVRWME